MGWDSPLGRIFLGSLIVFDLISPEAMAFLGVRDRTPQQQWISCLNSATDGSMDELQKVLLQRELEKQKSSSWLASVSSLPFECTSCGKCCRTIGNVYMSPQELTAAASYTNQSVTDFIHLYAESRLDSDKPGELPWILLRNINTVEKGPACVFLDLETNHCQIYPVRPIQCSTYPFWTNVLQTEYHWNTEVRRTDDDKSSSLPAWTAETGGCEGMGSLGNENTISDTGGVPIDQALEQLLLYESSDRRMPRNSVFKTIERPD